MDAHSEARLQDVNPVLAAKIRQMADILDLENIFIVVTSGVRTWADQHKLYSQGRTTLGNIVTNADAGHSWHNYGLACDCAPVNADETIDWEPSHPQWKRMETVGVGLGLVSGANWLRLVDAPHFQYTGRFPVSPDDESRQIFQNEGTAAFWAEVNRV